MLVNTRFQVLFHSPSGVLFTFPSQYCSTIGHRVVFRLGGWSPRLLCGFHVSADTLDPASFFSMSPTGLSPSSVGLPIPFCYTDFLHVAVLTREVFLLLVWPLSLSLATTRKISVDFFSSAYLDVSVRRVPFIYLFCSVYDYASSMHRVSSFGYPRIKAYLQLPVAFRSLSRPSSAPNAKAFSLCSSLLELI